MPCPERFRETLEEYKVEPSIIAQINDGYEDLISKSPKKKKAAYFKRALDIMTEQMEEPFMKEILIENACCKTGNRLKASKAFAKKYKDATLEERIKAVEEAPNMGRLIVEEDGTITAHAVYYNVDGRYHCGCPNFNGVKYEGPVSKNYCYCCCGHFKYHYEIMLGVQLEVLEMISSPLDSDGQNPCIIRFRIVQK